MRSGLLLPPHQHDRDDNAHVEQGMGLEKESGMRLSVRVRQLSSSGRWSPPHLIFLPHLLQVGPPVVGAPQ